MVDSDHGHVKPSEQRGGTTPDETEAREKGSWAGSDQGIVPPELGGSDAPEKILGDDGRGRLCVGGAGTVAPCLVDRAGRRP